MYMYIHIHIHIDETPLRNLSISPLRGSVQMWKQYFEVDWDVVVDAHDVPMVDNTSVNVLWGVNYIGGNSVVSVGLVVLSMHTSQTCSKFAPKDEMTQVPKIIGMTNLPVQKQRTLV